jgi:DNA-binding response OmpR family regulator
VRVLAVDDEPAIRAVFEVALRRAGYDVVAVDRGERALAELRAGRFDCVLLDFLIPDLRGDVIYAYAVGVQPHLAHGTVWVTGDITERTHNTLEGTGCPVLLKPFSLRSTARPGTRPRRHAGDGGPCHRDRRGVALGRGAARMPAVRHAARRAITRADLPLTP